MRLDSTLYSPACARRLLLAIGCFAMVSGCSTKASQPLANVFTFQKAPAMTTRASGSFNVKIIPQAADGNDKAEGAVPGRMLLDKQFHGDLTAVSKGQMLAAMTAFKGSAGYVAIEQVTGTLAGRSGSFILQHTGTMNRGAPSLSITVVPDSGTGELLGLTGNMRINIVEGKHFYEFDYTLADKP